MTSTMQLQNPLMVLLNTVFYAFVDFSGDTVLIKAIAETTGRTNDKIKADLKKVGDLGAIAEVCS